MAFRSERIVDFIGVQLYGCPLEQYTATLLVLQGIINGLIAGAARDLEKEGKGRPYTFEEEAIEGEVAP